MKKFFKQHKYKIFITIFLLIIILSFSTIKLLYNLFMISHNEDFTQKNWIYFSKDLNSEEIQKIEISLKKSISKVKTYFKIDFNSPNIIFLNKESDYKKYRLYDKPGTFYFTPLWWYLFINTSKIDENVIAHELTHSMIYYKLWYFQRTFNFATWIDEWIALQVDNRDQYSFQNIDCSKDKVEYIKDFDTPKKFWTNDTSKNSYNYKSAKCVISEFFEKNKVSDLEKFLSQIKYWEDYKNIFN